MGAQKDVEENLKYPGSEIRARLKAMEVLEGPKESFLNEVLGVLHVPGQPQGSPEARTKVWQRRYLKVSISTEVFELSIGYMTPQSPIRFLL